MPNLQSKRTRLSGKKSTKISAKKSAPSASKRKSAGKTKSKSVVESRRSARPSANKTQPAKKGVVRRRPTREGASRPAKKPNLKPQKPSSGAVVNIQAAQIEKLTTRLNELEAEVRALQQHREPLVHSEPAAAASTAFLPRHFDERLSEIIGSLKPGGGMLEKPDAFESDVASLTSNLEDLLRAHQELLEHISEESIQKLHQNRIGQLESAIEALADTDLVDEEVEPVEVYLSRLREVLLEDLAGPPAA